MRPIGFSTGALALSDFRRGVELQCRGDITACELSALREWELDGLLCALPELDLSHFHYLSFHAPSRLDKLDDKRIVEKLSPLASRRIPIVVHPDIIRDFAPWKELGDLLLLENMDSRKGVCQTAYDMDWFFQKLPSARFCFDIAHARQIDPTMSIAADLLLRFRSRLAEIHISEVNWQCKHVSIGTAAKWAYRRIARLIPKDTPVIVESLLQGELIDKSSSDVISRELAKVRASLRTDQHVPRGCALKLHN